jgi:O-antigen/teichoic acid export membrane protein
MSLKRNILASYASQIYVTLIGVVMLPFYIKYMGAEAYGLVGFFVMLQAWFQLLDMGLTPTMTRETARFQGGGTDALSLRRLLRALEIIFIGVAIVGAIFLIASASTIAEHWLKVQQLSLVEVANAIKLMAIIVAMRWICGLYRGTINGFERLVWLGGFNAAIATARFVLVIPLFIYLGASLTYFFVFQLVVAAMELLVLVVQTYRLLPNVQTVDNDALTRWNWKPLHGILKFSLSIAFTSSVWVLVTQTDKLVLSKLLPLADYAYFTMAVLVAGGVLVVSGPISGVLIPRMTRLNAEGDQAGLLRLYRNSTQLVAAIAIPTCLVLAVFSEQIIWAWTGDADIAQRAAPVLSQYALGNGILALAAFPAYLQFAKGDLKLHVIGNSLFVFLLIPALIWATSQHGVIGAGFAWLGANIAYFLLWVPKVHGRFYKDLHRSWLLRDVGTVFVLSLCSVGLSYIFVNSGDGWPRERFSTVIWIAAISVGALIVSGLGSVWVRSYLLKKVTKPAYIKPACLG